MITTTQDVHDVLLELEQTAEGYERDRFGSGLERGSLEHAQHFARWQLVSYGALTGQYLADVLLALNPDLRESKAKVLIREAANTGLIIRTGAGSATKYLTPESRDAEQAKRERISQELLTKAFRGRSVGLSIQTVWNGSRWTSEQSDTNERDVALAAAGKTCHKLVVLSTVDELIALLEGEPAGPPQEEALPLDV